MNLRHSIFIVFLLFLFSCSKDCPEVNPYFAEVYPKILDEIDIECTESNEEYYIYALINGEEFCHDQEKTGTFNLEVSNKFTTPSPNISISSGQVYDNARHGLALTLGTKQHFNEYFRINFPDFNLDRIASNHLDSLLHLEDHDILGKEDIFIPQDLHIAEQALLQANGGYLNKFLITLNSLDVKNETSAINFRISAIFGDQEGSYLKFNEYRKMVEPDGIYYYFDIEFECNLYHWPQYGYEGIWGEIREGRIVTKVKLQG